MNTSIRGSKYKSWGANILMVIGGLLLVRFLMQFMFNPSYFDFSGGEFIKTSDIWRRNLTLLAFPLLGALFVFFGYKYSHKHNPNHGSAKAALGRLSLSIIFSAATALSILLSSHWLEIFQETGILLLIPIIFVAVIIVFLLSFFLLRPRNSRKVRRASTVVIPSILILIPLISYAFSQEGVSICPVRSSKGLPANCVTYDVYRFINSPAICKSINGQWDTKSGVTGSRTGCFVLWKAQIMDSILEKYNR